MMKYLSTLVAGTAVCLAAAGCGPRPVADAGPLTMLVGCYTDGGAAGIYSLRFSDESGEATLLDSVRADNPSYLTPSADGQRVYAVSEGGEGSAALAYAFDRQRGAFRFLGSQPTHGGAPCYIIADTAHVVTANYMGGSISVFPLAADGSLRPASQVIQQHGAGLDPERQSQPHLHCVRFTPDGRYLLADDLGTDRIYQYEIGTGSNWLTPAIPASYDVAAGAGPRHLTFSPSGEYAYLITEMGGTVIAYRYAGGRLRQIQTVVADTVHAQGSGDIHISPDGRYLYASNRLEADGVAIFSIDPGNGTLKRVGYQYTGRHPRNFVITPSGRHLLVACRDDNVIQVYRRDEETGLLTDTGRDIRLSRPVCVRFVR